MTPLPTKEINVALTHLANLFSDSLAKLNRETRS